MKYLIILGLTAPAAFGAVQEKRCSLSFEHDSVDFDSDSLDLCMESIKPEYIRVFATASMDGSPTYNMHLSYRRSEAISSYLKERFPQAKIEGIGGGINPRGRKASIVALSSSQSVQQLKQENASTWQGAAKQWDLSATGSFSKFDSDYYQSINVSLENTIGNYGLGLTTGLYGSESVLNLNSLYATASYKYTVSRSIYTQLSALLGGLRSPNDSQFDGGLSFKASYQLDSNLHTDLILSKTYHMASVGVGLGASL